MSFNSKIKTIEWVNNSSRMIDQTLLPKEFKTVDITTAEGMYKAIKDMIVRGAPAIGIAGAHGVALAAIELSKTETDKENFLNKLSLKAEYIKSSRPTAVNLMWRLINKLSSLRKLRVVLKILQRRLLKTV